MLILFSIIANILFILACFPIWLAGTLFGWFIWYMNPNAHFATFILFQLIGFFFALPSLATRGSNIGVGVAASAAIGYILGKKIAKL